MEEKSWAFITNSGYRFGGNADSGIQRNTQVELKNGAEGRTRTADTWIFSPVKAVLSSISECYSVQINPNLIPRSTTDSVERCAGCEQADSINRGH